MSGRMIQTAQWKDLPEAESVYEGARQRMRETGNPTQWGSTYPPEELLKQDIQKKQLYVVREDDRIVGAFAICTGEDDTYRVIEQGNWLNDESYLTVHRVAGAKSAKGILKTILEFAEGRPGARNIRIDTHPDNTVMQHLLAKYGYTKCGVIHYYDGSPRFAYQKVLHN
jgi:RimJ/RimL family protein N-acetyltransferase